MAFTRAHSDSGIYFISAAHFSIDEQRELLLLDEEGRSYFQHKLNCYAEFCGIDLISYSILPDHFYLLVQVRDTETLSDEQLIERLKTIYKHDRVDLERELLKNARKENNEARAIELRQRFLHRMWDISTFMKELQLHFTKWYNRSHNRRGKFWESQFRSTIVEDDLYELGVITSYIELAAVREKLVKHPGAYRFATYGAALSGDNFAQKGICRALAMPHLSWKKAANRFLHWLYLCSGQEARGSNQDNKRYAHDIKTCLFEKRLRHEEWSVFRRVQQGDNDHPVMNGLLEFSMVVVDSIPTSTSVRLSPRKPDPLFEDRASLHKMRLANFQDRYQE